MNLLLGLTMLTGTMVGEVTYYGRGVMELVLANRLKWGHVEECRECVGMVALLDRGNVGKRVFLQRRGHELEGPFLVVDCAAPRDFRRLKDRGLVAEVDWQTAQRWGMQGPLFGVRVVFAQEGGKDGPETTGVPEGVGGVLRGGGGADRGAGGGGEG